MRSVLVVGSDVGSCKEIRDLLHPDFQTEVFPGTTPEFSAYRKKSYEFVVVDLEWLRAVGKGGAAPVRREGEVRAATGDGDAPAMPGASPPLPFRGWTDANGKLDFKALLRPFWIEFPTADVVVVAPNSQLRDLVDAVKAGASNYLTYPLNPVELKYVLDSLHAARRSQYELDYLRKHSWHTDSLDVVRTNNPVMREVFEKIHLVAPNKTTVMLTGETGTGKGVMAKLIHQHSTRADRPFISVHCGAIAESLLESELFGHEKGAFTGAVRRKPGKFEIAQKGTLFLDEVGTMSPAVQVKLLQVIQERTFTRVGGEAQVAVDVRIVAATNEDLDKQRRSGTFREDLYYRLNVFPIEIPPLRDRIEDIPILVEAFLKDLNRTNGKDIMDVHPTVMEALARYSWPGNIRELQNLIERAYILETSSILTPECFPSDIMKPGVTPHLMPLDSSLPLADVRRQAADDMERRYLKHLLSEHSGSIAKTANVARITVRQVHKLMLKHRLRKEDFRKP